MEFSNLYLGLVIFILWQCESDRNRKPEYEIRRIRHFAYELDINLSCLTDLVWLDLECC